MKKIGIVTLCGNFNYGNKLQNYALKKYISDLGYNVETVWIKNQYIYSFAKRLKWELFLKKYEYIDNKKRSRCFRKFNKHLNIKSRTFFRDDMQKVSKKYDCIVVGSDQVWNPENFNNDSVYLLKGINARKIAFSASFGVNNIPKERISRYRDGISEFDAISVREERGRELIAEISGRRDAITLVDPTMLLSGEDWDAISKEPENVPKKYILNYFQASELSHRQLTE